MRLSAGQPNLERGMQAGMQASLLDSCCYDVDLSMAGHGQYPVLHFCTFAVTKSQEKLFESSLVIFPQMVWFPC